LDALFVKDPQLCIPYSDRMVELYATFGVSQLMSFLRASNFYDLEKAYGICHKHDFVPEMVFLLGRMGNNKQALMLILDRLGDVQRAIEFAKEQADDDLWEDLLQYSEKRPDFIRALLEHVGAEINPIRLIERIRNGLEISGLKPALVKILQASNLQVSLLEGCRDILSNDCRTSALELNRAQTGSARGSPRATCEVCGLLAFPRSSEPSIGQLVVIYLCRHIVHAECALPNPDIELPPHTENMSVTHLLFADNPHGERAKQRELSAKLSYAAAVRVRISSCPVCAYRRGTLKPPSLLRQMSLSA